MDKNLKKLESLNNFYDEYDIDLNDLPKSARKKNKVKQKNNLVKTYWNKNYKKSQNDVPYEGFQDPNEIDWSVYGPDRPGKKKISSEQGFFTVAASESHMVTILSFFGLLLPGILSTLYFLGVPLTQVYLAGISMVTMYFLTGEGKSLDNESLTTDILLNVLQLVEAVNNFAFYLSSFHDFSL